MTGEAEGAYLLWSHKNTGWYRPNAEGYTRRLREAGWFPLSTAVELAAKAIPGTAMELGALPVLPVPLSAAAALVTRYREQYPDVPAEDWE